MQIAIDLSICIKKAGRDYFCNNVHESSVWYAINDHKKHLTRSVYHRNGRNASFKRHFLTPKVESMLLNDISVDV